MENIGWREVRLNTRNFLIFRILICESRFDLEDSQLTSLMKTVHNSFRIIDMSGGILNQFPAVRFVIPDKCGYRPLVQTLEPLWKFLKVHLIEIPNKNVL